MNGSTGNQSAAMAGPQQQARAATTDHSPSVRTFISLSGVAKKLGVSERTAHKIVAQPWWPKKIELAPRVHRWIEQEVDAAISQQAPRHEQRAPEPERLLRARIERMKARGVPA